MKSLNIDNSYSLDNVDNYHKELEQGTNEVVNKYIDLLKEYLNFIEDNVKIKNKLYIKFIIKRGLETITNVFLNILYYTKNLNLTYFHCQKSFYFYVEFIGQITDEQNTYLQLSSRDASTYVYRKTIFEINNESKKNITNPSKDVKLKFDIINKYVELYKLFAIKIINPLKNENLNDDHTIRVSYYNDYLVRLNAKLKNINLNIDELKNVVNFLDYLDCKVEKEEIYVDIIILYLKKIYKNTNLILKLSDKTKNENFNAYLDESIDKFINWLIE